MIKILFICHGNICRSTMAQSIFAHLARGRSYGIDSAATSREEIGNPPHPGTVRKLREMGIPCIPHQARQITPADYRNFDYILAMDSQNVRNLHRLLGGDPEGKIHKLLSFAGMQRDIADPWYTGNFDETYEDVVTGCRALLAYLDTN